jgi:hypothetical protein
MIMGAKSVCFHPLPDNFRSDFHSTLQPYLSDQYHKYVKVAVEECDKLGMNFTFMMKVAGHQAVHVD